MNAQEAIECLKLITENEAYSDHFQDVCKLAITALEKLAEQNMERSTDYYNGGWIPCSERLPEDDEMVLVTDKDGMVYPEILWYGYANPDDEKMCFHRWDDEMYNLYRVNAVAWMPLPEPYKGE